MRKTLRSGTYKLEILDKNESLVMFHDIPSAISFLSRFKDNDAQINVLRDILAAHSSKDPRLDAVGIIREFANLLVSGKLRVLKTLEPIGANSAEAPPQQLAQSPSGTTPEKKSWIEIYLHDSDGKPAAGEKYRIKLPDGSMEEGRLDAFGHAEYYGINPGTCELWFPDRDAMEWRPA
jgi:hypothetical protein